MRRLSRSNQRKNPRPIARGVSAPDFQHKLYVKTGPEPPDEGWTESNTQPHHVRLHNAYAVALRRFEKRTVHNWGQVYTYLGTDQDEFGDKGGFRTPYLHDNWAGLHEAIRERETTGNSRWNTSARIGNIIFHNTVNEILRDLTYFIGLTRRYRANATEEFIGVTEQLLRNLISIEEYLGTHRDEPAFSYIHYSRVMRVVGDIRSEVHQTQVRGHFAESKNPIY